MFSFSQFSLLCDRKNKFVSIPPGFLVDVDRLRVSDLSNNELETLEEKIFGNFDGLTADVISFLNCFS